MRHPFVFFKSDLVLFQYVVFFFGLEFDANMIDRISKPNDNLRKFVN